MPSQIGVFGLGVMGSNIALNLGDHGYRVSLYNRDVDKTRDLLNQAEANQALVGCETLDHFVNSLQTPRVILLMVTAGKVVDEVIESLQPLLDEGDIVIDGGNSFFQDTQKRCQQMESAGLHFIGMGVSGGEEGARHGPSLMPGGDARAWPIVADMFQAIAARAADGTPCCQWVGKGGAGHYVKMVHNGIEYGDMQLIAEAWDLMHRLSHLSMDEIADVFGQWNQGVLSSYLIEITAAILRVKDADGSARVMHILDAAGQKGTGRWTAIEALNIGTPLTLITESVFSRALSSLLDDRQRIADIFPEPAEAGADLSTEAIHSALYAAKIISYTQGFMQLRQASAEYDWQLDFGNVALLWRAGCIIRSRFLDDIHAAFIAQPDLPSLLMDDFFSSAIRQHLEGWRTTVANALLAGLPVNAMSAALGFYDSYRQRRSTANLLQAQRDFFGAHTYRRIDKAGVFHTFWSDDQREESVDA